MTKKTKNAASLILLGMALIFFAVPALAQPDSKKTEAQEGPPDTKTWTQLPDNHQEIPLAAPCMMCHNYKVDATTTATKQMVGIGKQLDKEVLWKRIADYLEAGKKTKTFVLGTSLNNMPLTTTCDWMLDPAEKVIYAFFEIGTEKLIHVRENPYVSMNYHKPWENNFSTVLCIQVKGKAELFDGSSPIFDKAVAVSFPGLPKNNQEELMSRAKKNMVVCRVTIDQIMLFDGTLLGQHLSSYQMWRRIETFTPSYFSQKK
jgi:hypothetical protein